MHWDHLHKYTRKLYNSIWLLMHKQLSTFIQISTQLTAVTTFVSAILQQIILSLRENSFCAIQFLFPVGQVARISIFNCIFNRQICVFVLPVFWRAQHESVLQFLFFFFFSVHSDIWSEIKNDNKRCAMSYYTSTQLGEMSFTHIYIFTHRFWYDKCFNDIWLLLFARVKWRI